jgi:hypothetical protein
MSLYVVSSETVSVQLDSGGSVTVPVYTQTRIGNIRQSAADVTTSHCITITRAGDTKSENFSVCVETPMLEGTISGDVGYKRRLHEGMGLRVLLRRLENM